ncbi:MAG: D-alanyl-D-alanine carboxypeptidase family protein [Clostridium sp.]|uniref:D-alanyl-D-alanine carboxypeptidase family protein n=1 Tax=Clostridium sp. TaxID=1506 RepID=UPI003060AA28
MKKKIWCFLFVFLFACCNILVGNAYATPIKVDAVSAIAIDATTGMILFDQNAHKVIPMASTTKIITALVALEYGDLDRVIEISKNAASVRGSKVGYRAGEKVTLRELLYGLMLKSGNDCAIAIAEGTSGSVEKFCKVMNELAVSIGILDSHFESPHGLDSASHYSSAYDLAIATKKAKEIEEFNKIVSTKLISDEEGIIFSRQFNNINKLLYQEPNCTGVKTGYTGQAGKCLVSSFKLNDNEIIVVTLNCVPRWQESQRIYEYVKENYEYKKVIEAGEVLGDIKVRGKNEPLKLVATEDLILPVKNGETLSREIVIPKYEISTPIRSTEDIGMLTITNELKSKYAVTLHSIEDVEKIGLWDEIKYRLQKK